MFAKILILGIPSHRTVAPGLSYEALKRQEADKQKSLRDWQDSQNYQQQFAATGSSGRSSYNTEKEVKKNQRGVEGAHRYSGSGGYGGK